MKKILVALLFSLLVASCTHGNSNLAESGYDDISRKIIKGQSTRADIMAAFGRPAGTARSATEDKWLYSYMKVIPIPYATTADTKTLEITFGQDGTVKDYLFKIGTINKASGHK